MDNKNKEDKIAFRYKFTLFLSILAVVLLPTDLFTYILTACAALSIAGMYHWFVMKVIAELREAEVQRDTYYAEIRALRKKLKENP